MRQIFRRLLVGSLLLPIACGADAGGGAGGGGAGAGGFAVAGQAGTGLVKGGEGGTAIQQTGGAGGSAGGRAGGAGGAGGATEGGTTNKNCTGASGAFVVYKGFPFTAAEAKQRQQETALALCIPAERDIDLTGGVKMHMVLIPAADTMVGDPPGTPGTENGEGRRGAVVSKPYYISTTMFTREQYKAVMGSLPAQTTGSALRMTDSMKQPALESYVNVRDQIIPKLKALSPDLVFRLPHENEFEIAARAGTETVWYTGDAEADLDKIGWYNNNAPQVDGTCMRDVALKLPNAWGLYDVVGNNWQWSYVPPAGEPCDDAINCLFPDTGGQDPNLHRVRGGACDQEAFGNGCRTGNLQVMPFPVAYRFVATAPGA